MPSQRASRGAGLDLFTRKECHGRRVVRGHETSRLRPRPFDRVYESLGFTLEIRADQFALLRLGSGTVGLLEVGRRAARNPEDGDTRLRSLVQLS